MVQTGGCVQDGICLCFRIWVLVIHNDFDGIDKFNRLGDDVDVENLRRVFETQRGCRFRELHNCGSEEIVRTLSQQEHLIKLFHVDGEEDPRSCPPAAFILIILSHGESGGVILTDHFKKGTDPTDLKFETYTTNDVWNITDMKFISSSLKLVFLGPCRGNRAEFKLKDDRMKENVQTLPGWLSSQPNKENLAILYSTVESTMANRCEVDGTWFVQAICKELENLTVNLPLLDFLTRIQFRLCTKNTIISSNVGQTSQLHLFAHVKCTVCPLKNIVTPMRREKTDNFSPNDISAESWSLPWLPVKYDAKAGNLDGLVTYDNLIYYDWLDKNLIKLKRGKAIIFHDRKNYECAKKMAIVLQGLGYTMSLHNVCNIQSIITKTGPKTGFKHDGSFVLCVMTQIFESENGLMIKVADNDFLLSKIIDEYTGTKCTQLIGKPKLFFLLDNEPNIKTDGEVEPETKRPDTNKYFNLHAGVCTFIGMRSGPKGSGGDVIENLMQELGSPQLKEEGSNLQTVLSEVIAKASKDKSTYEKYCIKPQFLSTLPQFVNFTPIKSPYEHDKYYVSQRVLGIALLTSILFAMMMILLGLAMRTPRFLIVNVDDSCGISFTGNDVLENDAFSLNSSEWSKISAKCSNTWKDTYASDYLIINALKSKGNSSLKTAIHLLEKSENKRESVYRVILLEYSSVYLLELIQFFTLMETDTLRLDGLRSVVSKVAVNCDSENIDVLELTQYDLRDFDEHTQSKIYNCIDTTINQICPNVKYSSFSDHQTAGFYSKEQSRCINSFSSIQSLSPAAQQQFVPIVIHKCYQNLNSDNFKVVISLTSTIYPKIACSVYQILLSKMENQNQLGSERALTLRRYSESFNNTLDQEEKQKCKNVVETLKLHLKEHAQPYLKLFHGSGNLQKCASIFDSDVILLGDPVISYVVKMVYNGSWENAEKILKCLNASKNIHIICEGTLALVKEFLSYKKLASFESLNAFSNFKRSLSNARLGSSKVLDTVQVCKNDVLNAAPDWIQYIMFDKIPVCDYSRNDNCSKFVIQDLSLILTDFETRNLTNREEILLVDFVLNYINNSGKVWREVEPLVKRLEPFKKQVLDVKARKFLVENESYFLTDSLWSNFGSRIDESYLPVVVREAYKMRGIEGMPLYIEKLNPYLGDACNAIHSLYLAMIEENIKNLETIETLYFYRYIRSVPGFRNINSCIQVMNGLLNYSNKGMDKYESYFRQNTTESFQILYDLHLKYKQRSLVIMNQLIQRFIDKKESFVYEILYFLKKMPKNSNLCPGIRALIDRTYCRYLFSCGDFESQFCNDIPANDSTFDYVNLSVCQLLKESLCN